MFIARSTAPTSAAFEFEDEDEDHDISSALELVLAPPPECVLLIGISWLCFPSYVVIKAVGSSDVLSTYLRTLHLRLVHL